MLYDKVEKVVVCATSTNRVAGNAKVRRKGGKQSGGKERLREREREREQKEKVTEEDEEEEEVKGEEEEQRINVQRWRKSH